MKRVVLAPTPQEQEAVRLASTFLRTRMAQQATLLWALEVGPHAAIKRQAVREVLAHLEDELDEPWLSAWRLIEESWDDERAGDAGVESYRNRHRLESGERTGGLIRAICKQVRPRLSVSARPVKSSSRAQRRVSDLVGGTLTSPDLGGTGPFELNPVEDIEFLWALAGALEAVIEQGIAVGRRLSEGRELETWRLGQLYWVAYREPQGDDGERDVDDLQVGIAPAVKLLHAVVRRLGQIDASRARAILDRWRMAPTLVQSRLWAALAAEPHLVDITQVEERLLALDSATFWDLNEHPELVELRALRFKELSERAQARIEARIRKGPPRSHWSTWMTREQIATASRYWIARELRRIQVGGGRLSPASVDWLTDVAQEHPELAAFDSLQLGFPGDSSFTRRGREDVVDYDALEGVERLTALETALGMPGKHWNEDPEQAALQWIRTGDNAQRTAHDLVSAGTSAADYPKTLNGVAWSFSLREESAVTEAAISTARELFGLITRLPAPTLRTTTTGLAYWLSTVAKVLGDDPAFVRAWFTLWPVAVAETNAGARNDAQPDLNEVVSGSDSVGDRQDLDALNVPAGHMVSAFLPLCPTVDGTSNPFAARPELGQMRAAILEAPGKAGLVGLHRFVEHLAYFLRADPAWTQAHVMSALKGDDGRSLALWRALSRRMPNHSILKCIGELVAQRTVDPALGRERRVVLLTGLVNDTLNAFLEPREPTVSHARLTQILRASDDETRARTAQHVQRFLASSMGKLSWGRAMTPEYVFTAAIAPFLKTVWPQERSLATPGVAAALADIPASAGEEFEAAVHAVMRFLVPFDCWSMSDYGFWSRARADKARPLSRIDTPKRVAALLELLDATIGTADHAVVPIDLNDALEQIEAQSGPLARTPQFRRLAALSRRG